MKLALTIFTLIFSNSLMAVEVYKNDFNGVAVSGDINILKKAAEDGKAIRVKREIPPANSLTLTTSGITAIYNNGALVCLLTESNFTAIGDTPDDYATAPNHVFANICSDGQVHVRSGSNYYNHSNNMTWYVED